MVQDLVLSWSFIYLEVHERKYGLTAAIEPQLIADHAPSDCLQDLLRTQRLLCYAKNMSI